MADLPSGTVTFLITDVVGSTQLMRDLGERYGAALENHRRLLREELGRTGGREVDTQGDAFFFAFQRAREAVAGAVAAQRALAGHDWPDGKPLRVRMGLHTGEPQLGTEGYHGLDVVRASRIASAAHGGQILVSETTRALLGNELPEGVSLHDLGRHELKDVQDERVFELAFEGREEAFPPLRTEGTRSSADALGDAFGRRIEDYVARSLERAFEGALGDTPKPAKKRRFRRR